MNKGKYFRQIGYGLAGLAIGVIVYVFLLSTVPASINARSEIIEFDKPDNVKDNSDYVIDDENGETEPLFKFGTYHVSDAEFTAYMRNGIVTYGKENPTRYYTTLPKSQLSEEDIKTSSEVDNIVDNIVVTEPMHDVGGDNIKITEEGFLEGFNIHSKMTETKNVLNIQKQLKNSTAPLDNRFLHISSDFGLRIDPFTNQYAYHVGTDFSTLDIDNANIYAVLDGVVVESVENDDPEGLGNYIVIEHDGFETLYAHMNEAPLYNVGSKVSQGDIIGYVGSTGRSTGPHLHFEVGIGGLKFNYMAFVK